VTTDEFHGRLATVREGLDSVLGSLNDLEGRTWGESDQVAVALSLIRAQGELEDAGRLLSYAVSKREIAARRG
jgi:hypothetical protein